MAAAVSGVGRAWACEPMGGGDYSEPPEVLRFELDSEQWHVATRLRTPLLARKEFVLADETPNRWTELVTWNVIFGRSDLAEARAAELARLRVRCESLRVRDLESEPGELLFEWHHAGCYGLPPRHTLVRLVAGETGLHVLTYGRNGGLGGPERESWLRWMSSAPLERRALSGDDRWVAAQWDVWKGNYDRARRAVESLVEEELPEGIELLALLRFEGWGVKQDRPAAAEEFERAARLGSSSAARRLARMYDEGLGLEADAPRALTWYRRAAEGGDPEAQARLGVLLSMDAPDEAAPWLARAVDGGHSHARYFLARLELEGRGIAQDIPSAVRRLKQAARDGEPDAQFALGRLYADGVGVQADDERAIRWLTRAVSQGRDEARVFYQERYGRASRRGSRVSEGRAP